MELKLGTQMWPVRGAGVAHAPGDVAGAGKYYEHVIGDGRVAVCFEFQGSHDWVSNGS